MEAPADSRGPRRRTLRRQGRVGGRFSSGRAKARACRRFAAAAAPAAPAAAAAVAAAAAAATNAQHVVGEAHGDAVKALLLVRSPPSSSAPAGVSQSMRQWPLSRMWLRHASAEPKARWQNRHLLLRCTFSCGCTDRARDGRCRQLAVLHKPAWRHRDGRQGCNTKEEQHGRSQQTCSCAKSPRALRSRSRCGTTKECTRRMYATLASNVVEPASITER